MTLNTETGEAAKLASWLLGLFVLCGFADEYRALQARTSNEKERYPERISCYCIHRASNDDSTRCHRVGTSPIIDSLGTFVLRGHHQMIANNMLLFQSNPLVSQIRRPGIENYLSLTEFSIT
jgi:hypothetical protein